ncbi:hypothetical protein A2Z33_03760 [Candidatus Gottesmanbacteria bacterium RBG_16_52_11]|uniref:Transcription termination factor Rho n=1 Tax=Candidatus Gottesmanbacteria bacterium RBG_16_52_11 TaxID=1798374 RepID=A0A1F5YVL2_9BACT|nr:MAG: hypothetical protein A2Z33_03760 [Candidatus Gottesmanbacteria bacterium RBG_16_52_11]
MAYRASTKKTAAKKKPVSDQGGSEPAAAEPKQTESSVSVEDIVGGPVTPAAVPEPVAPVQKQPVQEPRRPAAPGMTPVPFRMGRYHRMPRRDFGDRPGRENGNGFTQDINVPTETVRGILDIIPEGHGFLRPKFTPSERDVYISQSQIRRFLLRNGDMVEGQARQPKDNERYWGLLKVEKINQQEAESMSVRPKFEDLVPVYPNKQIVLETESLPLSTRIVDLVAPIGFGQRGLVVSPPKAGKTTILKELASGISANYPNVHLMAALIGERPEEVTDITRNVKGEVLASNFDESPADQTRIAEVALDRAKRLVEIGKDVVILLDSITRLARAYNLVVNPSGRTLSGGFDPAALYPAKRFLGAARCVEPVAAGTSGSAQTTKQEERYTTGGSLTVIGTALIDTGSRMDDLIYEEFKGTGNMELHLSRSLQERRIFPAIDVEKSGTRHDELLLGEEPMKRVTTLRHMLSLLSAEERTMMMIDRLSKTKSNAEFLESLAKG